MRSLLRASAVLVASTAVCAQQYFLTPKGFHYAEGNTEVYSSQPFSPGSTRYQYLDGTQAPTSAKVLRAVEMRRRASEVPGSYPSRTTNLTVVLAHTSVAFASPTFAVNYKNGQSTVAYSGIFNLPDLGAGPLLPESPWLVKILYTTPFNYNGVDDLLIELQCEGTTPATLYPLDMINGAFMPGGHGSYHGYQPCRVSGKQSPFLINLNRDPVISGGRVSYDMYATDGPANQPAVWILGLSPSYTNLGGALCAHLQPTPQILVPMTTNAIGGIGSAAAPVVLSYPYPGYVHQVFAQFCALDATQSAAIKVSLSDDIKYLVGDTGPYNVKKVWTNYHAAVTGVLNNSYVPIMRHTF